MAETELSTIFGKVMRTLESEALHELFQLRCLQHEIERLKSTLSRINCVLPDAENRSFLESDVQGWIERLRGAMFSADDILDGFCADALRKKAMKGNRTMKKICFCFSCSDQLSYGFRSISRIKKCNKDLYKIAEMMTQFRLVEQAEQSVQKAALQFLDAAATSSEMIIGRDEDKSEIIQFLLHPVYGIDRPIISIIGSGGSGKTSLARYVYDDQEVITHFKLRLWVNISLDFDVKRIVESILEYMTGESHKNFGMSTLAALLDEKINGKKYLLVLDDVWNEDYGRWCELMDLLVGGAKGSRVIVTTRSEKVAIIIRSYTVHEIKGLSNEDSWSLFEKIAFRFQQDQTPKMREIGMEIVDKCDGIPLDIRAIAGLLFNKRTEFEWQHFIEKEFPKEGYNFEAAVRLIYDNLPSMSLKQCFAYCSLFPKDYEFEIGMLIHLWMAQGYIHSPDPSVSPEEVGFQFFMLLLQQSFFQDVKRDKLGDIKSCKMNNLMRDFAISATGHGSNITNSKSIDGVDGRTYHMSLGSHFGSTWQTPDSLFQAKALRTLLLPNQEVWLMEEQERWKMGKLRAIISNFRRLRVFDLHNSGIEKVPPSIDMLKHLRYLDVSDNDKLKALPNSVTKLINLEVLKLSNCEELKELPEDMRKLVSLRHLYLERCWSLRHMPLGLGQLTSLQTLTWFVIADLSSVFRRVGRLKELGTLNNLRGTIEIRNLKHVKNGFEAANLGQKKHLQSLSLCWNRDDDDIVHVDRDEKSLQSLEPHENLKKLKVCDYGGVRFPSWLSSLKNLVDLCLQDCGKCELLPQLQHIQSLKYLRIHGFSNMKYIDHEGDCNEGGRPGESSFFSSLEELYLVDCPNLEGWWKKSGDLASSYLPYFDSLHTLEIRHCPLLTNLPLFPNLHGMLTLENVSFEPLHQTVRMEIQSFSSSSMLGVHHFTLNALWIVGMEDLKTLPQELLEKLTSLQELHLIDCPQLASLPLEMRRLASLRELDIGNCCMLKERCGNGNCADWQKICHIPNIRIDGRKIQWGGRYLLNHKNVASPLSKLRSMIVKGLEYLPEDWLQNFTCLEELRVVDCPKLMSLPRGMRRLISLQLLDISQCPYLKEACENSNYFWDNIDHVPSVQIDGKKIKWQGRYVEILNE